MTAHFTSFAGTSLRDDDFASGRVLVEASSAGAAYRWDCGYAVGRYLASLQQGKLVGCHCAGCDRILFPPRAFCEQCFRPTSRWVDLADTGVVQTFAISHIAWDATRVPVPSIPAVIAIDGASPQMGLLHLLGNVEPEKVAVGQRVRARWRPAEERQGAITDIMYFEPVEA
jgi:uncharacterized OB-fold protein